MCDSQGLAQSFVIGKDKGAFFLDRASRRAPELIAFEGGNRAVKEVSRVQSAVAEELIHVSVKAVGSRARHGIDHAARGPAVSGGVVAAQHRKLLDGVDAQVGTEHAARCAVRVVVDADPVQTIVVLIGTGA